MLVLSLLLEVRIGHEAYSYVCGRGWGSCVGLKAMWWVCLFFPLHGEGA